MNKNKVLFMGRKSVAAKCLRYLLEREDVDVVGVLTDSHLSVSPTAEVASANGIRIYEFEEALREIDAGNLHFDLGLSMLYWRKLKGGFLDHPRKGIINFHPAILPDFKGTAGYNLAILEGLSEWAVSAHYVDEEIDTGGIIEVSRFPIDYNHETAQSLEHTSQEKLYQQFKRVVERAISSTGLLATHENSGGRYVSRREMEEMKEVRPGDDVLRKIRAFWFPPYDGAFVWINGHKCTLVDRYILESLADSGTSSLFTEPSS